MAQIAAYNMSKAADLSLVKSLAMEWGKHNIRVNAIAPGLIQTDFAKALWDNPQIRAAPGGQGGAEAHRPARRYRRRRGLPRFEGRRLRLRPDASSPTAA